MAPTANDDGGGAGVTMTGFFGASAPNAPIIADAGVRLSPLRSELTRMMCTEFFLPPQPMRLALLLLLLLAPAEAFLSPALVGGCAVQKVKGPNVPCFCIDSVIRDSSCSSAL